VYDAGTVLRIEDGGANTIDMLGTPGLHRNLNAWRGDGA
jgi:hypothetical protein